MPESETDGNPMTAKPSDGGPAYPSQIDGQGIWHYPNGQTRQLVNQRHVDMSLRAHFAGCAMQGFITTARGVIRDIDLEIIAHRSIDAADALLQAFAARQEHVPDAVHEGLAQAATGELVDGPDLGGNGDGNE